MAKFAMKAGLDPTLPDVTIEIGGRERQMAYHMVGIMEVEKLTGVNLLSAPISAPSNTEIVAMLYAALIRDDPKLPFTQVAGWVNPFNANVIHQAVLAAWYGSLPDAEKTPPGEDEAQAKSEA